MDVDAVALLGPGHPWVPWWVDRPEGRSVEVDICLPPEAISEGWSFVDLELDVIGDEFGFVRLDDEDEFQAAYDAGWLSADDAELAVAAAKDIELALRRGREPFGATGWARLIQALARPL
jgi:predicted RNA-binding protein associated with RNAse of E/G family